MRYQSIRLSRLLFFLFFGFLIQAHSLAYGQASHSGLLDLQIVKSIESQSSAEGSSNTFQFSFYSQQRNTGVSGVGSSSSQLASSASAVDPAWPGALLALNDVSLETNILDEPEPSLLWNLFIAVLIVLIPGSIVALCVAAIRQWRGSWRIMAIAPLGILLAWVALIVFSIILRPGSHSLWVFELFVWAMATSVYMMLLMTAKKAFLKADQEKSNKI